MLFIDARKMGYMVDRTRRDFSPEDVEKIIKAYHSWRTKPEELEERGLQPYEDVPGFCKAASVEEIKKHGFVLTPGRYVGAEAEEDDGVPFEEKFAELRATLEGQFAEGRKLEARIEAIFAGDRS